MTGWLLALGLLTLVYVLALGRAGVWDILFGALIATLLLAGFRRWFPSREEPRQPGLLARLAAFLPFAAAVCLDVLSGTWDVTRVVLDLQRLERSGIVAIPFGDRSRQGVAVTTLVTTLSPGSVLVDIDPQREVMYFHFLDASDPDRLRETYERFYQRYQRQVFP